jgi:hypothetical protein
MPAIVEFKILGPTLALVIGLSLYFLSACATTASRDRAECELAQIEEVIENPVSSVGKLLCGEVFAVRYGRTVRILSSPKEMPPSDDLTFLVRNSALLLGLSETPRRFYVEAIIRPQLPCFTRSKSEARCVPYDRPIHVEILTAHPVP